MKTRRIAAAVLLVALVALAARSGENAAAAPKAKASASFAGYRGFSFALPGAQLAFVSKGDRVDVLSTFEATVGDTKDKERVTATILQNCVVRDLRKADKPGDNGTVELLLNPVEAQYLALALQEGAVQVIRRFEDDREMKPMEIASFRKLFR